MNCRSLETVITEIAREQILEAQSKAAALAHLHECRACTARLADERALSAGLGTMARSVAENVSAQRIEGALVSAFRQRTSVNGIGLASGRRTISRIWSPWSIAAAATILVVASFAVIEFVLTGPGKSAQQLSAARPVVIPSPPASQGNIAEIAREDLPAPFVQTGPSGGSRSLDRGRSQFHEAALKPRSLPNASGSNPAGVHDEIATDFMPLTDGAGLSQLDDMQMVRLELPRSVLQSFGLPMNAERAGQRVKADVLLGQDGVARAIRFVR
ncbi:MAG: hypothetical protein QOJ64_1010 [Acidobacteriota bacterium]|jgi:hypothetical protein|nr:hypothetical protein [Acidobacteriota bacterium]